MGNGDGFLRVLENMVKATVGSMTYPLLPHCTVPALSENDVHRSHRIRKSMAALMQ